MYKAFLIKYGEIGVKGKNRHLFEYALMDQIRFSLSKVDCEFSLEREHGRIYVMMQSDYDYDEVIEALKHVFGIVAICPVVICEDKNFDSLCKAVGEHMAETYKDQKLTFKVYGRRADKAYPKTSMELACDLGEYIIENYPNFTVDVHEHDVALHVEVREKTWIYSVSVAGPGGMPVGTNGKATLLLSGGIDSPVAGYMIAKRGVKIDAVYFHAPPYTSERAKQKVVDLAKIVAAYAGPINLHVINFTDVQLAIYDKCPHEQLTIIMRRYMMKIAEHIALEGGSLGLITGESIGQVASQTMQSLNCTNNVCTLPVYRPVIGFDKNDIIAISEKIGAYETSIQPFEDCCTIFVAKHPVTKPTLKQIERSERRLTEIIDDLVKTAIETREVICCE